jgi:excisionase family DNA binding protein
MSDRLVAAVTELVAALREELRAEATAAAVGPDRLLGIPDVAIALGVTRSTVYQELAAGRLRSLKVGRRRLVPSSAIYDFVTSARSDGALR